MSWARIIACAICCAIIAALIGNATDQSDAWVMVVAVLLNVAISMGRDN